MHADTTSSGNLDAIIKKFTDGAFAPDMQWAVIKILSRSEDAAALTALAHGSFVSDQRVAEVCKSEIRNLPRQKLGAILNFIIDGGVGARGGQFIRLVHELRTPDVMKYLLHLLANAPSPAEQYKHLAVWFDKTGLTEKNLRIILAYPPQSAKVAFTLLTRLDSRVPRHLAKMAPTLPPKGIVKALMLLAALNQDSKVTTVFIRRLAEHQDPEIRARTVYLIGRTTHNPLQQTLFMQRFIVDPAAKVRLQVVESIDESPHEKSAKIIELLHAALSDSDPWVRGKAAQILYLQKDVQGFRTLKSMLERPRPLERAVAARLWGELKEVSVLEPLKRIAQNDPNEGVRAEAEKALKGLDEERTALNRQLDELEGLLTRHQFSKGDIDETYLFGQLEGLDKDVTENMLRCTGLPVEVIQQFGAIIAEFGVNGSTLPLLLATVLDDDGRVNPEQIADLSLVKRKLTDVVQQLQNVQAGARSDIFDELNHIQRKTVRAMITPALEQGDTKTMVVAGKIMHELKYEMGSTKLREMAADADAEARKQAALVLSTIPDQFATEQMERLADDSDPEIQGLAKAGLSKIGSKLERNNVRALRVKIRGCETTTFPTVRLYASVCDQNNQTLTDLESDDFTALEGKDRPLKVKIASRQHLQPIAVAMGLDYSASMTEAAIRDVAAATTRFIDKLQPADNAAIVKFGEAVEVTEELTQDKSRLTASIGGEFTLSQEGTALYDSIIQAIDQLEKAGDCMKLVIVTTDGEDTTSDRKSEDITDYAVHKDTAVYTIGLGDEVDTEMLEKISRLTDGRYYAAANSSELQVIYEGIFDDIRFAYEISYESKFSQLDERNENATLYVSYGQRTQSDTIELSRMYDL